MANALDLFQHIFIDNKASKTLFLLSGTGASESDLIPLVSDLKDQYNFVGILGNDTSEGMTRFFRRNQLGNFDQDQLKEETKKLADFLNAWYDKYELTTEDTAFLGYSNGANMILAMTFNYPKLIQKAAVLHCKLPFTTPEINFKGKSFLVTYGMRDRMITKNESEHAIKVLQKSGAEVSVFHHPGGHEIVRDEVEHLQKFLEK